MIPLLFFDVLCRKNCNNEMLQLNIKNVIFDNEDGVMAIE